MGRYANIDERRRRDGSIAYRLRVNARGVRIVEQLTTLEAALARRAEVLAAIRAGTPIPQIPEPEAHIRDDAVTVHDLSRQLVRAMRSGEARTRDGARYKPSVVRGYERELRRHVLPIIGALPVAAVTRRHVQEVVDTTAAEASPEIARKALNALRVLCRLALSQDLIDLNPCRDVRAVLLDESDERPARVLEPLETRRILRAAERDDRRMRRSLALPLVRLALDAGLRSGEALGLRWGREGVDLDAGVIRVLTSLDRERDADGAYARVRTKSRAGRREIPLSPALAATLRRHREASRHPEDGRLVLADERGDPLVPGGKPRATWLRVRAAAELDDPQPRFHELRHAYATHLLAAGLTPHAVAQLLGHADAGLVWRRYGHALPSEVAGAGERLHAFRERSGGET